MWVFQHEILPMPVDGCVLGAPKFNSITHCKQPVFASCLLAEVSFECCYQYFYIPTCFTAVYKKFPLKLCIQLNLVLPLGTLKVSETNNSNKLNNERILTCGRHNRLPFASTAKELI